MPKQKKKRNKKYTGADAAVTRPVITRMEAVNRSRFGQWWFEKKRIVRPLLITTLVIGVVVWLLIELVRVVTS